MRTFVSRSGPQRHASKMVAVVATAALVLGGMIAAASASAQTTESDTWTSTGSLDPARKLHTAALLDNGQVLVAGGVASQSTAPFWITLTSAELYNPGTGTWSTTGSLATPRVDATATTLADGRVLVAGGRSAFPGVELTLTEIYDPATGTWSPGASMSQPRAEHLAVRLDDGRVLVAGQRYNGDNGELPPTAEIYDPQQNQWTATAPIGVASQCCNAQGLLLPDGRVLTTLGTSSEEPGGPGGPAVYDPVTNSWSQLPTGPEWPNPNTGPQPLGNGPQIALLHSGNLLFASARHSTSFSPTNLVAELDPVAGTWTKRPRTNFALYEVWHPLITLPDGRVLATGGDEGVPPNTDEVYDPVTATWTAVPEGQDRLQATVTVLADGRPLIVGGVSQSTFGPLNTAAIFEP